MQEEYRVLDCSYSPLFSDEFFVRLPFLRYLCELCLEVLEEWLVLFGDIERNPVMYINLARSGPVQHLYLKKRPSIISAARSLSNSSLHMIGPAIPHPSGRPTTPEAGPSVGPYIPTGYAVKKPVEEEEEEEEDDYVPELPPDLAAQRTTQKARTLGPSLPSAAQYSYDDSDDDDVGPMPLPAHLSSQHQGKSAVEEFLEREKRRKQAMEVRDINSLCEFPDSFFPRTRRNQSPSNVTSGCWCPPRSQTCSGVRQSGVTSS